MYMYLHIHIHITCIYIDMYLEHAPLDGHREREDDCGREDGDGQKRALADARGVFGAASICPRYPVPSYICHIIICICHIITFQCVPLQESLVQLPYVCAIQSLVTYKDT